MYRMLYATYNHVIIYSQIEVLGRKKIIKQFLEKIKLGIEDINDPNTLDQILAMVMKAGASITVSDSTIQQKFEKNHFATRQ